MHIPTPKIALLGAVIALCTAHASAQVRVVTSTPTLGDIAKQIGGDHVEVQSIMRGPENAHNVIAKPSHMLKLRQAEILIHTGLDAEPWIPLLIKGARNSKLHSGEPGNVNASAGIKLKDVPKAGQHGREHGDIHAFGNTHYLMDPHNAPRVARTIRAALEKADPTHRDDFRTNYESFEQGMRELEAQLLEAMQPMQGTPIATYHRSWTYFLERFGLVKVAEVEPKPGVTPWPAHLQACIDAMQAEGAKLVIVETFSSKKSADFVAKRVGGAAVVLALEVGAMPGVESYQQLMEYNVNAIIDALGAL